MPDSQPAPTRLLYCYRGLILFLVFSFYAMLARWIARDEVDADIFRVWQKGFHLMGFVHIFHSTVAGVAILKGLAYLGLYKFWSWGRVLFIGVLTYEMLISLFLGRVIVESYENVWVEIQMMAIGIVLTLSYSSPLRKYFSVRLKT